MLITDSSPLPPYSHAVVRTTPGRHLSPEDSHVGDKTVYPHPLPADNHHVVLRVYANSNSEGPQDSFGVILSPAQARNLAQQLCQNADEAESLDDQDDNS